MGIKALISEYSRYRPEILDKIRSKCSQETKFGRVLNVLFVILFYWVRKAKALRAFLQNQRNLPVPQSSFSFYWPRSSGQFEVGFVLIVAELSIPQCTRYRVLQKVEMFKSLGYQVHYCSFTDQNQVWQLLPLARVVIFYRVPAWEPVRKMIQECRRLNIPSYFDIDDLVFDVPLYSKNPYFERCSKKEAAQLLEGARLYGEALAQCDHAIASTPVVQKHMKRYTKGDVLLIENALDAELIAQSLARSSLPAKERSLITIGYGSGTKTHDDDFALVVPALCRILAEYKNVRLAIHGYLKIPDVLNVFENRIFQIPFLKSAEYYDAVSEFDINLAPLTDSEFNDAKSNIKFLEAAIFAVPTVASPSNHFSSSIVHGSNGLLATQTEDWYHSLKSLIENSDDRLRLGQAAQRYVLENYSLGVMAERLKAIHLKKVAVTSMDSNAKSNPQTLLVVNVHWWPHTFGGATVVAEALASGLQSLPDWNVKAFTSHTVDDIPDYGLRRYTDKYGIEVVSLKLPSESSPKLEYSNPLVASAFRKTIEVIRPHKVHFHCIQRMGAEMLSVCSELGVPFVVTLHDAWWVCERQFLINKNNAFCGQVGVDKRVCAKTCTGDAAFTFERSAVLKSALAKARLLLAPSDYQRKFYEANGFSHVVTNKNGVAVPKKTEVFNSQTENQKKPVCFAYLGGKATHKGYFFLQKVFRGVTSNSYRLVLVDLHLSFGRAEMSVDEWPHPECVEIHPPFSTAHLDDFYSAVDVLIVPSLSPESFGLAVREALFRNKWVLVSDLGGAPEDVVEGKTGNILTAGDEASWAACLQKIIEQRPVMQCNSRLPATLAEQVENLKMRLDTLGRL